MKNSFCANKWMIITVCILLTGPVFAQTTTVLTYNIRYDNPDDGVNAWKERKDKLMGLIRKEGPNIFCVQEALFNQMQDLEGYFPEYQSFGVGRDDGKTKGEYAAIFYQKDRYEKTGGGWFWLSPTPSRAGSMGWDAACTRIATWVKLTDKKTGNSLLVLNTHFDHVGEKARIQSAKLVKDSLRRLAPGQAVIVTGDFNCGINTKSMKKLMSPVKGLRLFDSRSLANDVSGAPHSYTTFSVNAIPGELIDHILVTWHFKVSTYQILCDSQDGRYYSDHLPVKVVMTMAP